MKNIDTTIDWKSESRRFDGVADLYDTYRPEYPEELVESLLSITKLPPNGKILEIGSGTGKATMPFAKRGFSMTCIEPGKRLVAVARRRLEPFPHITFEPVEFEAWDGEKEVFDAVISAQAFHWIPPETGYTKVASVLKKTGSIALFWNMYPDPKDTIFEDLNQVYQKYTPELAHRSSSCETLITQRKHAIMKSGFFGPVEIRRFPWSVRYNTQQYLGLLNTYSGHLRLAETDRMSLFDGIARVIDHHGGLIERPYLAVLYVAPKL